MSEFMPAVFGRAFHKIVMEYLNGIGIFIAPLFHIGAVILICLVLKHQNKYRRLLSLWLTVNYSWFFLYVGLYMLYRFYNVMGLWSLAFWGDIPVLLTNIVINLIKETRDPDNGGGFGIVNNQVPHGQ